MSRHSARVALDQLVNRPALIAPIHARQGVGVTEGASVALLADIHEWAMADPLLEAQIWEDRKVALATAYSGIGFEVPDQTKPFAFTNGLAVIPIQGTLVNRFQSSYGYVTGYNFIRSQLAAAEDDPDVKGIVYDVNSYGGMVSGCQETSDAIAAATKPSLACVDANCYSAAYMLASGADSISVTPSGGAGSIGVVMMHVDVSEALKNEGIKVSFIHAGEHKVDGNMYEPLSAEVRAEFQAEIDASYDMFVAQVVKGRGLEDQAVRETEARIYRAEDALVLGLIDAVQNPVDAVEAFFNTTQESDNMPPVAKTGTSDATAEAAAAALAEQNRVDAEAATAQAAATAAATARTTERTRIAAIQSHAEAADRQTLARHLALNTDMDVDAAAGILAASPKEAKAAPAVPAAGHSPFKNAMAGSEHPNVGAGAAAETGGDDQNVPQAQRILGLQARVTGVRPRAAAH